MVEKILKGINSEYLFFPEDEGTVLSAGKFSATYIGAKIDTGQKIVVKRLNPKLKSNEHARLRFLIEASVQVNNPGVIKTIDLIKNEDSFFLIQEFINGIDLKKLINTGNFKNETVLVCRVMNNLMSVLQAIHNHNIVHRDLKPSNIIIAFNKDTNKINWKNPDVRIIDFGLAKTNDKIPLFYYDKKRHPFSLLYSAPEVVLNKENLTDHRADIYSAGLIMMEMFTGQPVFYTDNPAKIIKRQISDNTGRPAGMYPYMYNIYRKSTAKKTFRTSPSKMPTNMVDEILKEGLSERYSSADEMMHDLMKFMNHPGEMPKKGIKGFINNNFRFKQ